MLLNAVFWICFLIFYFSLLKYTYHYNYRSHISLQVAKLAKSAGDQILIFPTVYPAHTHPSLPLSLSLFHTHTLNISYTHTLDTLTPLSLTHALSVSVMRCPL